MVFGLNAPVHSCQKMLKRMHAHVNPTLTAFIIFFFILENCIKKYIPIYYLLIKSKLNKTHSIINWPTDQLLFRLGL